MLPEKRFIDMKTGRNAGMSMWRSGSPNTITGP